MIRNLVIIAALGSVLAAGCRHKCCRKECDSKPYMPPAPNSPFLLPPAGLPTTPGAPVGPSVGPIVPGTSNFPPPVINSPPVKPAPEVLLPDPIPGTSSRPNWLPPPGGSSSKSLFPSDPAAGAIGQPPVKAATTEPPAAKTPSLVGLPGYVKVKPGVASGRKPTLDGFEALKQAGYRTVVYSHATGADVSATKDVATQKGLALVAIETTPENLADSLETFNRAVADGTTRPAYVCDDDGLRVGVLWYLHFRTAEAMNDDAARVRARPLGLTDQGDEAKAFALAAQRILESR